MTGLGRHALVWLSQAPQADDERDATLADRWHAEGRPFVVCRRRGDGDNVSLGFCVVRREFPEIRPRRVGARTPKEHIIRTARPPVLAEVARCGPALDRAPSFRRLADEAARAGRDLRVYGSWMWQALTGEAHVRPTSDLDLLVDAFSPARRPSCRSSSMASCLLPVWAKCNGASSCWERLRFCSRLWTPSAWLRARRCGLDPGCRRIAG